MFLKVHNLVAIAILNSTGFASPISASVESETIELRGMYPIQLFMGTCVVGRSGPRAVGKLARDKGFKKAPRSVAEDYLAGGTGTVWYAENEHGRFAVVYANNGLCSVFLHQGDPETIKASMESWLPPKNVGFSYTKEELPPRRGLETTSYTLYRGKEIMERWVLTVSKVSDAPLVAIMSYDSAET